MKSPQTDFIIILKEVERLANRLEKRFSRQVLYSAPGSFANGCYKRGLMVARSIKSAAKSRINHRNAKQIRLLIEQLQDVAPRESLETIEKLRKFLPETKDDEEPENYKKFLF